MPRQRIANEKSSVIVPVRFTANEAERLSVEAAAEGISVSELVRRRTLTERWEPPPGKSDPWIG